MENEKTFFIFLSHFLVEVPLLNRCLYLLNSLNKTLKKNGKKILEKSGKFLSLKMWESWFCEFIGQCYVFPPKIQV